MKQPARPAGPKLGRASFTRKLGGRKTITLVGARDILSRMREYIFIDEARVQMYYEQLSIEVAPEDIEHSVKKSVDLKGPAVEHQVTRRPRTATVHEKIEAIYTHLKGSKEVAHSRPTSMPSGLTPPGPPFVLETASARKLIIPGRHLHNVPGLRHFAVWVADPDPSDLSEEEWNFSGTFLLLAETFWDGGSFQTVYSGCSALQAIANVVEGRALLPDWPPTYHNREPLGRGSSEHPVQKLSRLLGAVELPHRRITTLYRKRYMTNEQVYEFGGKAYRVNDLLAYPLYIQAA